VSRALPGEGAGEGLDPRDIRWDRVATTSYLIRQRFRYDYPGTITGLEHRLVIVPPEHHADQRRVVHHLNFSPAGEVDTRVDAFGNTVVELSIPAARETVEFRAWISVERRSGIGPLLLPSASLTEARLLRQTELTQPDSRLLEVAGALAATGAQGLALAGRVNAWVFRGLHYQAGVTGVDTTAAQVMALGRGVCQDYAHVMLSLCRALGLPSRYVSGHMLGEGGTHAWVEVLVPDPGGSGMAAAFPFDPTHGRVAGLDYVTVAVGRDYRDVAPTSGRYATGPSGRLTAGKRVDVTNFAYAD
jgi:transglutaminase-like putative cysteine protease